MIKRILEISSEPFHVAVRLDQLQLCPRDRDAEPAASLPCEDIGVLVVDNAAVTFTHQALVRLIAAGATVVLCGSNHHPTGIILPLSTHTEVATRQERQASAGRPLKKRLWKQIIRAKIRNQAANLPTEHAACARLLAMVPRVRSGDPENFEAQAARFYWEAWLGTSIFRRSPEGEDSVNGMLNYGYAIVRAAVARALVSAGLNPALGLHHQHRANAFCLADDLMEPIRPWVDAIVAERVQRGEPILDKDAKKALLGLLHRTVQVGGQTGPLLVGLHRTCASLVRCFEGAETKVLIPRLLKEHGPCT